MLHSVIENLFEVFAATFRTPIKRRDPHGFSDWFGDTRWYEFLLASVSHVCKKKKLEQKQNRTLH